MRADEPFVLLGATNGQHRGDPTEKTCLIVLEL